MNEGLSVLAALLLLSIMLSAILAIAWARLGRAPHALTWAVAFGVAAVQWSLNVAHYLVGGEAVLYMLVNILSVAVAALLTRGFRQRAGRAGGTGWLAAAGVAAVTVVFVATFVRPDPAAARVAPLLYRAVVLAVAAAAVIPAGRRANAAEASAAAMLWAFSLFSILVAAVAMTIGARGGAHPDLDRWMLLLGLPTAFTGTGLFAVLLLASDLSDQMRRLASRDALTGVLNRRGFEEQAAMMIANAARQRQPLALALADLDRFKAVNDMHGHAAGDMLLCRFARAVEGVTRQGDVFARLGGEEFVLLLVNTDGEAAVAVIDRLRREAATLTLPTIPPATVTTSFGVAVLHPGETCLDALMARADGALYRSKQDGRDRVTLAPGDEAAG